MKAFTEKFGKRVYEGDSISCSVDGFKAIATVHHDPDLGPPWREHDGHGIVREDLKENKRPGERVMGQGYARDIYFLYDFAATVKKAKAEGWDAPPYKTGTKGQQAERAAESDFRNMQAWLDDKWTWCYVLLTVYKNGIKLGSASLCGIECNYPESGNSYLCDAANELLDEALDEARKTLAKLTA